MKERDLRIDFLRFLGLTLIVLAHVQAPYTITQIRCFDVPLMLFISGLTSAGKTYGNYWNYVQRRTKRLIIPVWLFLFVYLTCFYIAQSFVGVHYLTWSMIWRSFLLLDHSIGYVWIIRVFLLVMLLTPSLVWLSNKLRNVFFASSLLLILGCILHLVYTFGNKQTDNEIIGLLINDIILYMVGYSIPFVAGLFIKEFTRKQETLFSLILTAIVFTLFIFYSKDHSFPQGLSSEYKIPPHIYYICYGVWVSVIFWYFRNQWGKLSSNRITSFVGQNTIWIYLWHMPFALLSNAMPFNWTIKYIIVYGSAICCFCIQYYFVKKVNSKFAYKYLVG